MNRTRMVPFSLDYYLQVVLLMLGSVVLTVCPTGGERSVSAVLPGREGAQEEQTSAPIGLTETVIVAQLMQRIIAQESSGDSSAINPDSGALGLGQVMPDNLPAWSQAALGRQVSAEEFLASTAVQRQIISFKLAQDWKTAIAESLDKEIACRMVAATWYSGDPMLYQDATPQFYKGAAYPSIADYTLSVCSGFADSLTTAREEE